MSQEAQAQAQVFQHKNDPENLKALLLEIVRSQRTGDVNRAAWLTHSLIPNMVTVRAALRDNISQSLYQKIEAYISSLNNPPQNEFYAKLFTPKEEQTEVQVHGATTEEIQSYQKGSTAWKEFPGGARKMSLLILREKVTFYEVEFLKPGSDLGIKYHLFYWSGKGWKMLGPIWRISQ